jgi:gluconate 5-dehydrogenase
MKTRWLRFDPSPGSHLNKERRIASEISILSNKASRTGAWTTEIRRSWTRMQAMDDKITTRTPAGRWGQTQEVTGAAVYFASRASLCVTGETIRVDGGYAVR